MRVALKIAYDGGTFYGHQRQPDRRTVEGECLAALRAARILRDPTESFFRSASRTDRGVSAIGNVIAFDSSLPGNAALGAFNDRARDVWAWAVAEVPASFHPRHAIERWYRYHLDDRYPVESLQKVGRLFEGDHDVRSFTSDPPPGPHRISSVEVRRVRSATLIDVRAGSFRRGMVRRIVAAMLAVAQGDARLSDVRTALGGVRRDFGSAPPEPLFLMDVRYGVVFHTTAKPKVVAEWRSASAQAQIRMRFLEAVKAAAGLPTR